MSDEEENSEESQPILSPEDAKVLKDLKLMTDPYAKIAEQNLELLGMLAETEVAEEAMEGANKQLLEIIEEKDQTIADKNKVLTDKQKELESVNQQLLDEKARVEAIKSLYKKETAKRRALIKSVIPSEKEIDSELEE